VLLLKKNKARKRRLRLLLPVPDAGLLTWLGGYKTVWIFVPSPFAFRKTVLTLLLAGASAFIAFAHAILVKSTPAANEIIAGPNVPVELNFNSRVDQARSTLTLETPSHSTSRVHVDVNSSSPAKLTASISGLASGSYKLHWQVLAVDGHITRGEITFQVK
jgi:hypothetical protein